ncbi:MAG: MoxR family ATPase, partial [Acidobacteria bacterium]|nr:MoxR family ATPase [Acidobacteriota bacterium]
AQLDRFLLRVEMSLPAAEDELEILRRSVRGELTGWSAEASLPAAVTSPEEAAALRSASRRVHVSEELLAYLGRLAAEVRKAPPVELGPSPRGSLALLESARGTALLEGRDFVTPDDLKRMLLPCWGHRILLTAEAELEGHSGPEVLGRVAESVEVPH